MKNTWKEAFEEVVKDSRFYINKHEYIELIYPAMIFAVFVMTLIGLDFFGIINIL